MVVAEPRCSAQSMDMDMRYDFRIVGPNERIVVAICTRSAEERVLQAVLAGERQPLTDRELARVFLRMPAITLKVMAAIHWEALKLWAKRIGFRPRSAPPARAITIVTEASAALD